MAVAARTSAHPRLRIALLVLASACDTSGGSSSCDAAANGGLNQGRFAYVCAPHVPSRPGPDAFCDEPGGTAAIPDVAVGASFALSFDQTASSPQPALAALAVARGTGWSLVQPGWLGFVAWSGSDVFDFTHVHGRAVATLELAPSPVTVPVPALAPVAVAVVPHADDGAVLAGAIACTFTISDPAILSVSSDGGRVALLTGIAGGDATLVATCLGVQASSTVHVAEQGPDSDSAIDAGSPELESSTPADAEDDAPDASDAPALADRESPSLEAGAD